MTREPCPNAKIIKNLCTFACSDPAITPAVNLSLSVASDDHPPLSPSPADQSESNCTSFPVGGTSTAVERGNTVQCDPYNGILLLVQQQKVGKRKSYILPKCSVLLELILVSMALVTIRSILLYIHWLPSSIKFTDTYYTPGLRKTLQG